MDISGYRNRGKCCVGLISWCSNLTKIEVSFFSKEIKPLDIEIDNEILRVGLFETQRGLGIKDSLMRIGMPFKRKLNEYLSI